MGKVYVIATLVLCITAESLLSEVEAIDKSPKAVEKWFKQLSNKKERMTKLRFYLHETNGGIQGKTIYPVAQPDISLTSATSFGKVSMFDDPLKAGRDPKSQIVGTAQGSTGSSSLTESSSVMTLHFTFTAGRYNDSTLIVIGRNPLIISTVNLLLLEDQVLFDWPGEWLLQKQHKLIQLTRDLIIEYNVVVIHYDSAPSATIRKKTDTTPWSPSASPGIDFSSDRTPPFPSVSGKIVSDKIPWCPSVSQEIVANSIPFHQHLQK